MKALVDTNTVVEVAGKQCNPLVDLRDIEFDVHPSLVFYDFNEEADSWPYWYRDVDTGEFIYDPPVFNTRSEEEFQAIIDAHSGGSE